VLPCTVSQMPSARPFRIIPCAEWGARPPRQAVTTLSVRPRRIIFHHTAGHVPNLSTGETYAEALRYARSIQAYHMDRNGWIDSGHNFLVTRGGFILEGRHRSRELVQKGKMVVSAHCPGQNDQPGIEHEHVDPEAMTPIQHEAAVWLAAWICRHAEIDPSEIKGHRDYYATACPGSLYRILPAFRAQVAKAVKGKPKPPYQVHIVDKDGSEHWQAASKLRATRLWTRFLRGQFKSIEFERR
jgi:N-acetylmuramoyl-L-alanine amidase-like protein